MRRDQPHAQLLQRARELESFFGLSLSLFCIADDSGYFRQLNPPWEATLGYSRDELLARPYLDFVHPDDVAHTRATVDMLQAGRAVIDFTNRYRHRDGSYRWIEWRARKVDTLFYATARDITAQREAEMALAESELRLRRIFDQAADGIFIISAQNRYLNANNAGLAMLGYSREELLGTSVANVLVPNERERLSREPAEMLAGRPHFAEWLHMRKDGSTFVGEVSAQRLTADSYLAIVRDLSERRKHEAAALENESRLRLALDAAQLGTFDWDIVNDRITWSHGHERLWGFNSGEFGGTYASFAERVHPDDLPVVEREIAACSAERRPFVCEFRVVWPDQSVHWVIARGEFAFDTKGEAIRMRGAVADISDRKLAEAALKASEEHFRTLFEQANDAILVTTADGGFLNANAAACEMFGYTKSELLTLRRADIVRDFDTGQVAAAVAQLQSGTEFRTEAWLRRKDGSTFLAETTAKRLADGRHQGFVRDITERRRDEERLRQQELGLRESAEQLRRLARRLERIREEEQTHLAREIHDRVGQALTLLKLELSRYLTSDHGPTVSAAGQRILDHVDDTVHAVRQIAAQLRPPILDDLGLGAALEWAAERFTGRTGIACHVNVRADDPNQEAGNAIYGIVQEAFTNVVRHAEARNVNISLTNSGDQLVLTFVDDGKGFDARKSTSGQSLGVLGMRERAAALGGDLVVSSIPGRGTTLTARIPSALPTVP